MRQVIEIEDAVNGMRINIYNDQRPSVYRENATTKLEVLQIAFKFIQKEIIKEERVLRKAAGMI